MSAPAFAMVKVETFVQSAHLRVFKRYAARTGIDPLALMQRGVVGQMGTFNDSPFGNLIEFREIQQKKPKRVPLTLEFCPDAAALLAVLADLLQLPVGEMAYLALSMEGRSLSYYLGEAEREAEPWDSDMLSWAESATKFAEAAKRNVTPSGIADASWDAWGDFGLSSLKPSAKAKTRKGTKKGGLDA